MRGKPVGAARSSILALCVAAMGLWASPAWAEPILIGFENANVPPGVTLTFTPGLGNSASISNIPVSSMFGGPSGTIVPLTGGCGGSACLNVVTGGETSSETAFGTTTYGFGPGGTAILTGTINGFTGVLFTANFSSGITRFPVTPTPCTFSNCSATSLVDSGVLNASPALLSALGIPIGIGPKQYFDFYSGRNISLVSGSYSASVSEDFGGSMFTPEPGTLLLLASGLSVLGLRKQNVIFFLRRR